MIESSERFFQMVKDLRNESATSENTTNNKKYCSTKSVLNETERDTVKQIFNIPSLSSELKLKNEFPPTMLRFGDKFHEINRNSPFVYKPKITEKRPYPFNVPLQYKLPFLIPPNISPFQTNNNTPNPNSILYQNIFCDFYSEIQSVIMHNREQTHSIGVKSVLLKYQSLYMKSHK